MIEIMGNLAVLELQNSFGEEFLGNIEGYIDTFSELRDTLKEVANTYTILGNAQKEQNRYGKLSAQTVAELLATNMDYAYVLDFEIDEQTK